MHRRGQAPALFALAAVAGIAAPASAQLRVANWNVSTYPSAHNRDPDFQTSIYATFQGRRMAPDILLGEEFITEAGLNQFVAMLNSAPGSPGDWAAAPWHDGPDTESVFFFRTAKVQLVGTPVLVVAGSGSDQTRPPRDVYRYDVQLLGYATPGSMLACYAVHMKSGSSNGTGDPTSDQARRLVEATAIRQNSNNLPAGWHFLIGGDFNIQSSAQLAYQELVAATPPNAVVPQTVRGQFFDPIKTPGNWNANANFLYVHTQAPGGNPVNTGGMDDRFDIVLVDSGLTDTRGFEYLGNATVAYSTGTWNDPNHSFRAWGNDGVAGCCNAALNITNNQMVGTTIAQAIVNTTIDDGPGGHLPVFLDLRVPGVVGAPTVLDFGDIPQNSLAQRTLTVANAGDTARWTAAGISALQYTLGGSPGVAAPGGTFTASAGAAGNNHTITINTSALGPFNGAVQVFPADADTPTFVVTVTANITAACYPNCDGSTTAPVLNVADFTCFLQKFAAGDPWANCDGSTTPPVLNVADFTCFLQQFAAGCP